MKSLFLGLLLTLTGASQLNADTDNIQLINPFLTAVKVEMGGSVDVRGMGTGPHNSLYLYIYRGDGQFDKLLIKKEWDSGDSDLKIVLANLNDAKLKNKMIFYNFSEKAKKPWNVGVAGQDIPANSLCPPQEQGPRSPSSAHPHGTTKTEVDP